MASTFTATIGHPLWPRVWDHGNIPSLPVTYSLQSGTLPAGLSFDSDGSVCGVPGGIYGTPSGTADSYPVTIRANNGGLNVDEVVTIVVVAPINVDAYPIYYWNESGGTKAQKAAQELASALNVLRGTPGYYVAENGTGKPEPSGAFLVGEVPYTGYEMPDGPDIYEGSPNPFRFVVKRVGSNYMFRGGVGRMHVRAVTWYLERFCGFLYAEASVTIPNEAWDSDLLTPGYSSTMLRVDPDATGDPLLLPGVNEKVRYRYAFATRGYLDEWNNEDAIDKWGVGEQSEEFYFGLDYMGSSVHNPAYVFQVAGPHPTQGVYAQEQTGVVVKDHTITGVFEVDETVEIRRGATLVATASVTWPATDDSYYLFLFDIDYEIGYSSLQTDDAVTGLTSGATCAISGGWLTDAYPMIGPVWDPETDTYDPAVRERMDQANSSPGHMCYSDPNIALVLSTILRRVAAGYTAYQKSHRIFFLGTRDWWGDECKCDRCTTIYGAGNLESETLVQMLNAWVTDVRLYTGFEEIRVGSFAYFATRDGPLSALEAGTYIRDPHLRYCIHHQAIDRACPSNRSFDNDLRGWVASCATNGASLGMWDYFVVFNGNMHTVCPAEGVLETMRRIREMSCRDYLCQGSNGIGGDRSVIRGWVWANVLLEPAYPVRFWVNQFCDRHYGAAADDVKTAWATIEDAVYSDGYPSKHEDEFQTLSDSYAAWMTPAIRDSLQTNYDDAIAAVTGDSELERRVHEFFAPMVASLQGCMSDGSTYANPGEWRLGDHPTIVGRKVIERDLGDGRGYRYTYDLCEAAYENSRGSAPNEYTNGPGTWLPFLGQNGGEVKVIQVGSLVVEVYCNVSCLRIRRIAYDGFDIVPAPSQADGYANWPFAGGVSGLPGASAYGLNPQGAFKVSESSTQVKVKSFVGVGAWGGIDGRMFMALTVDATGDPYIEMVYSIERYPGSAASVAYPVLDAVYVDGVTITPDQVNDRYDVTDIPDLAGITVRDAILSSTPTLERVDSLIRASYSSYVPTIGSGYLVNFSGGGTGIVERLGGGYVYLKSATRRPLSGETLTQGSGSLTLTSDCEDAVNEAGLPMAFFTFGSYTMTTTETTIITRRITILGT